MAERLLVLRTGSRSLLSRAIEAGFTSFLLEGDVDAPARIDAYRLRGDELTLGGRVVGKFFPLRNRADQERVRALKGRWPWIVVEPQNWKVIPLENLVAALNGRTRLMAVARSPREAQLFFGTLERGVDGVLVEPKSVKELAAYRILLAPPPPPVKLVAATVTRVEPVGLGERVCVDTCNEFAPGQGLLVGSASHGFFLVAAECYETEYVPARPFRVNAGALHAYVWNGDATRYLSELRAGQGLEAVDAHGRRRRVVVGRAKIETRPLLLVEAEHKGRPMSVILQNAETIRLVPPSGRAKSVVRLKPGDRVLVHLEQGARHFGMKVQERIRER